MTRPAAPKVAQVVSSLAVGGAERAALEIAAGLRARGWDSELAVVRPRDAAGRPEPLRAEAGVRGVPVRELELSSLRDRRDRARAAAFLRDGGYRLLNAHNRPCDWQVTLLGRWTRIPAIYTRQLGYTDHSRTQRALYFAAARVAPALVAITHAVADHLHAVERAPRRKIHVIPDGVDVDRYRPPTAAERSRKRAELGLREGDFAWLCAARLVPQKGFPYLLRALRLLPPSSGSRLLVAGGGPERRALEHLTARFGLGRRVAFLGVRSDVPELLWAADGYACASLGEGQGVSLVEAMAAGVPVVAPRLACIEEVAPPAGVHWFGPRVRGWAHGHDPDQIAAALLEVERGGGGSGPIARRHVVDRYSIARMLDGYERLYRTVLAKSSQPSG